MHRLFVLSDLALHLLKNSTSVIEEFLKGKENDARAIRARSSRSSGSMILTSHQGASAAVPHIPPWDSLLHQYILEDQLASGGF